MSDLNIKAKGPKDKEGAAILKRLFELGYEHVAWNHTIFGKPTQANLNNLPKLSHSISVPDANAAKVLRRMTESTEDNIHQYQRLTIIVDEFADAQTLHNTNDCLKSFDIIAATPSNAKVFGHLCREADIDIICFDFTRRLPFSIVKKTIDEAVKRGIYFEIKVGPCLYNAAHRRETFSGVKHLIRVLRGRSIVLTSGSESVSQLRGPFDIQNIGKLLQLSESESHEAIFGAWRNILQHAASRRRRHYPVALTTYQHLLDTFSQHDNILNNPSVRKRKREEKDHHEDANDSCSNEGQDGNEDIVKERHQTLKQNLLSDESGIIMFD